MSAGVGERGRIIPEQRVSDVGHHGHFSVGQTGSVLTDDGWLDNRVPVAMHNQHRLSQLREQIIVVERARALPTLVTAWATRTR
jgi:hypothetical protein